MCVIDAYLRVNSPQKGEFTSDMGQFRCKFYDLGAYLVI